MAKEFRWGIIGTGRISAQFAAGLQQVNNTKVTAAASLSGRRLEGIEVERYYHTYEQLCEDSEIDGIYIGNIHPEHYQSVKLCLTSGKPVLCEKPVTINSRECRELIELANKTNAFFMEAMWTRFIPANRKMQEICREQTFGAVKSIHITFGYPARITNTRLFRPELGGGALMDVGIYGVSYANMLLGEHPVRTEAWSEMRDGADMTTCVQMSYPSGCIAEVTCSIDRRMRNEAYIITEDAEFSIPFFWRPEKIYQYQPNKAFVIPEPVETYGFPITGNGYGYEAEEVIGCISAGQLESEVMPHQDTLKIMETMDQIREQCGIIYPQDK